MSAGARSSSTRRMLKASAGLCMLDLLERLCKLHIHRWPGPETGQLAPAKGSCAHSEIRNCRLPDACPCPGSLLKKCHRISNACPPHEAGFAGTPDAARWSLQGIFGPSAGGLLPKSMKGRTGVVWRPGSQNWSATVAKVDQIWANGPFESL